MKKRRNINKKSLENLKPVSFTKDNQPTPEAKSEGQKKAAITKNIIATIRTNIEDTNLIQRIVEGVSKEVDAGNYKNGIELLKIAKEPETQNIKLDGGVEVQKVFIDKATKQAANKHIDDFIDGN